MKHVSKDKPLFGICGGYQMLGTILKDPHKVENGGEISGLGLLSCETIFETEKVRVRVDGKLDKVDGVFNSLSGIEFEGEIQMGINDIIKVGNNIKRARKEKKYISKGYGKKIKYTFFYLF